MLAARPGHGKTLLGLEIAVAAMDAGKNVAFFSLEYTGQAVLGHFNQLSVVAE